MQLIDLVARKMTQHDIRAYRDGIDLCAKVLMPKDWQPSPRQAISGPTGLINMPFVITAMDHAKPVTYQRTTAGKAIERATKAVRRGMSDVEITNLVDGRTYRCDEFDLLCRTLASPA